MRIRLSNLFGTAPVTIGPVHVGAHGNRSAVLAGTDHEVTFKGQRSVTIAPGADVISDPVRFSVSPLEEIAVSVYVPLGAGPSTIHSDGIQTAYITSGNDTAATSLHAFEVISSRLYLTDVEVAADAAAHVIVAIGDSITDGDHSTLDRNSRWPDALAARLQSDSALASIAVVNAGIAGNRLLTDGPVGPSALSRFDRDALDKAGVRWVLLLEGINDIGLSEKPGDVSAEQIIDGMKGLISKAHAKGIAIWGGTLTPFGGSDWPYHSAAGEATRQKVNAWIRGAGAFDAVIDFDKAVRDPAAPERILPAIDGGDHLHLNDAGYKAMAESIDLRLFMRTEPQSRSGAP